MARARVGDADSAGEVERHRARGFLKGLWQRAVGHERVDLPSVEARDLARIEAREGTPVVLALGEDGVPRQARLRAFQDEELEEHAAIVNRDAPLFVVVATHQVVVAAGPGAARAIISVPILPPAPGLLSTMIGCFKITLIFCAI